MALYLTQLADYLQAEGLRVVEHGRWWELGRAGAFRPVGVGWHHTAVRSDRGNPAPSVRLVTEGRADLAGPLCHLLPAWDGVVHVIAAGRANHGGASDGTGTGPIPAGDANALLVGLELDYHPDYQDGPSPAQYRASIAAAAAVLRLLTALRHIPAPDAARARGHYEWSTTGKWDPGRLGRRPIDLGPWRGDLGLALRLPAGAWYRNQLEDDVTPEDRAAIAADVVGALRPLIDGARVEAWNARLAALQAVSIGQQLAAAVAAGDQAQAAALGAGLDQLQAALRADVANVLARMPRATTARYDRPGAASYDELAALSAGLTYDELTIQAPAAVDAAVVRQAAREGTLEALPAGGTFTLGG